MGGGEHGGYVKGEHRGYTIGRVGGCAIRGTFMEK